eukprot:241897-Prorocentrum_minimum.AAC.1
MAVAVAGNPAVAMPVRSGGLRGGRVAMRMAVAVAGNPAVAMPVRSGGLRGGRVGMRVTVAVAVAVAGDPAVAMAVLVGMRGRDGFGGGGGGEGGVPGGARVLRPSHVHEIKVWSVRALHPPAAIPSHSSRKPIARKEGGYSRSANQSREG